MADTSYTLGRQAPSATHLAKLTLVTSVRSIQKASRYTRCCGFSLRLARGSLSAAPIRNSPAGTQTKITPSTGEVQLCPISVHIEPELIVTAGRGVLAGRVRVICAAGDASAVTT